MRILFITAYFPPDTGSAAHLFYELGTELSRRGHEISVITSLPGYHVVIPNSKYKKAFFIKEDVNGMNVIRVATPRLPRRIMAGRALWQFSSALAFLIAALSLSRHDITLVYSPPLTLGLTAWLLKRFKGTPFIFNVQDLFPQSIIDLGLLKNHLLVNFFETIERFIYHQADLITVHSQGNAEYILSKIKKKTTKKEIKVKVIPNWVDTEFIKPGKHINRFREEYSLGDKFIVSFAGILGYSQDLDIILDAAKIIEENGIKQNIIWLIVGDGVERERLITKAKKLQLSIVRFLPMQARSRYPDVLQASNVCLATLHAEVKTPVVPSKVLSIMAAARPIVAALNINNDARKIIEEANCGICVPAEDPEALAEAVLKLYNDASLCKKLGYNGRLYVEKNFSLHTCADYYEDVFLQIKSNKLPN